MKIFNYESKQVIDEDDQIKANELIDAGKAVELDLPELEHFEKQASDIHETYQKEVERIKTSDNPIFTDEVKKYELARLKEEYEQKSAAVEAEYLEYRAQAIEDARQRAAQATVKVTDADRLTAEQFATRARLNLATAINKVVALKQIRDDIALLTDGQKTALQSEIIGVLAEVDNDYIIDKQAIISAVQDVRDSDLLAYEVAQQLPHTVLTKQRQQAIIERAVNGHSALRDGTIDREFYEKHLKGKGSFNA